MRSSVRSDLKRAFPRVYLVLSLAAIFAATGATENSRHTGPWRVIDRSITRGRDGVQYWEIELVLRNEGPPQILDPATCGASVDAWVSNSRVPGHEVPKRSHVQLRGGLEPVKTTATVLASSDDAKRCLERVRLEILPEPESRSHVKRVASDAAVKRAAANLPWTFPTGTSIRIRLRLEHDHFLYGPYDPLLGRRKVHIEINNHSIIDEFDLFPDPVSRGAATPLAWPATDRSPPEDRLDQSVFRSPPDSLHLEAHLPGAGSYRFPDCPIPYGSRLRLRFWYLIATGSDGVGRVRLVQSSDAPSRWRILSAGECEQTLAQVGRWTKFEHTFRADLEATTLAVDFRLAGEFGEAWFDDITLDVLDEEHPGP